MNDYFQEIQRALEILKKMYKKVNISIYNTRDKPSSSNNQGVKYESSAEESPRMLSNETPESEIELLSEKKFIALEVEFV